MSAVDVDPATLREILAFWFAPQAKKRWFASTRAFDREIRQRFESTYAAAVTGRLDAWESSAEGALALVIVLDQFPLNMYRGEARGFSGEALARDIAARAIEAGLLDQLDEERKGFMLLPFMHSERAADQERSVALYREYGLDTRWAEHHQAIIARFGRFPHRNRILGRESTPDELAYLGSEEGFQG